MWLASATESVSNIQTGDSNAPPKYRFRMTEVRTRIKLKHFSINSCGWWANVWIWSSTGMVPGRVRILPAHHYYMEKLPRWTRTTFVAVFRRIECDTNADADERERAHLKLPDLKLQTIHTWIDHNMIAIRWGNKGGRWVDESFLTRVNRLRESFAKTFSNR